jgi:ankyrin repeat protein
MSMLHQACISGSLEVVRLLVESGCRLDLRDNKGYKPFHYAAQHGKIDIVALLLRHGVSCNETTHLTNETPLHLVIQNSLINMSQPPMPSLLPSLSGCSLAERIVLLLLSNDGHKSLITANKQQQQTPFEVACELGRVRVVETILKFCSSAAAHCSVGGLEDDDVVYSLESDVVAVAAAPAVKNNISLLQLIYKYSLNALHLACKNGHDDIARLLLMYNVANINRISEQHDGGTALHEACRYGRYQTVKLLLEVTIP